MEFGGFFGITAPQLVLLNLSNSTIDELIKLCSNGSDFSRLVNMSVELKLLDQFLDNVETEYCVSDNDEINELARLHANSKYDVRMQELAQGIEINVPSDFKLARDENGNYLPEVQREYSKSLNKFKRKLSATESFYEKNGLNAEVDRKMYGKLFTSYDYEECKKLQSKFKFKVASRFKQDGEVIELNEVQKAVIAELSTPLRRKILDKLSKKFNVNTFENIKVFSRPLNIFNSANGDLLYRAARIQFYRANKYATGATDLLKAINDLDILKDRIGENGIDAISSIKALTYTNNSGKYELTLTESARKNKAFANYFATAKKEFKEMLIPLVVAEGNGSTVTLDDVGASGIHSLGILYDSSCKLNTNYYVREFNLKDLVNPSKTLDNAFDELDDIGLVGLNRCTPQLFANSLKSITFALGNKLAIEENSPLHKAVIDVSRYVKSQLSFGEPIPVE